MHEKNDTIPDNSTHKCTPAHFRKTQEASSPAAVPAPVAAAVRAVVELHLADEARDYLGQDETGRATHILPHLVALARYAAPDCLALLADCEEDLLSLGEG